MSAKACQAIFMLNNYSRDARVLEQGLHERILILANRFLSASLLDGC
jgi:hypothetical protein